MLTQHTTIRNMRHVKTDMQYSIADLSCIREMANLAFVSAGYQKEVLQVTGEALASSTPLNSESGDEE